MTADDDTLLLEFLPQFTNKLHGAVVNYLRHLGSRGAEDLAQDTLLRVWRNVTNGEPIRDLVGYSLGVARRVYFESRREPRLAVLAQDSSSQANSDWPQLLDQCLHQCMKGLSRIDRHILKAYYAGQGKERIKRRRELAAELGITQQALRLRVLRLRKNLRECVEECLAGKA
jgi:RNA polymerase sigma factor (sigma-70 family)